MVIIIWMPKLCQGSYCLIRTFLAKEYNDEPKISQGMMPRMCLEILRLDCLEGGWAKLNFNFRIED